MGSHQFKILFIWLSLLSLFSCEQSNNLNDLATFTVPGQANSMPGGFFDHQQSGADPFEGNGLGNGVTQGGSTLSFVYLSTLKPLANASRCTQDSDHPIYKIVGMAGQPIMGLDICGQSREIDLSQIYVHMPYQIFALIEQDTIFVRAGSSTGYLPGDIHYVCGGYEETQTGVDYIENALKFMIVKDEGDFAADIAIQTQTFSSYESSQNGEAALENLVSSTFRYFDTFGIVPYEHAENESLLQGRIYGEEGSVNAGLALFQFEDDVYDFGMVPKIGFNAGLLFDFADQRVQFNSDDIRCFSDQAVIDAEFW